MRAHTCCSLTYCVARSTPSLTPSLTISLTHSLTHSAELCAVVWRQQRKQALSLKPTPDKAHLKQPLHASPALDSVRSSLPQLKQGKQVPKGGSPQAKGKNATAPSMSGQPAGPRLPSRTVKRLVPPVNHRQVLVSKDKQHVPVPAAADIAGFNKQQSPEEESASKMEANGAVGAEQVAAGGQPSKKKKDRKEKKRKPKGSKQSSAAQESSTQQDSSSIAGHSHRGRSLSVEPSDVAAADQASMVRYMAAAPIS